MDSLCFLMHNSVLDVSSPQDGEKIFSRCILDPLPPSPTLPHPIPPPPPNPPFLLPLLTPYILLLVFLFFQPDAPPPPLSPFPPRLHSPSETPPPPLTLSLPLPLHSVIEIRSPVSSFHPHISPLHPLQMFSS